MNQNLFDIFSQYFPADRNKLFLTDHQGRQISYSMMESSSGQVAHYLVSLGLQPGDRVAVQVKKSAEALMIYLACVRAGLVYLPLNTGYRPAELEYFFADAKPRLIIADPQNSSIIEPLAQRNGARYETLAADGSGSLMAASSQQAADFTTVTCAADDLAAILYTSGTTGQPKGAMLSHQNLSSNALVLKDSWGWSDDDVLLHVLPIFHVHGLFVACHCVLAAGASMVFLPEFNPARVIEHLSQVAVPLVTVMMGVPTFYTRLLAEADFNRKQCEAVRLFISGSAPLLEETHHQFEQRTGHKILERYGMSETSMLVSNPLQGERRAGTVGFALPGVTVRIVDDENQTVGIAEVGSIQVKGPNVFQGYWQMPEKTAQEFTDDGFFITGDQGQISADGYISIVGRAKDMVITGGYNVYPKEVELVLDALAGVKESAVFGVVDDDFGEAVNAVIVADGTVELQPEQLIAEAKQQLASYKVPKQLYICEQLPRNTMGKVQKNILRQRYAPG